MGLSNANAHLIESGILKNYRQCEINGFHFILRDTVALYADFLYEILSGVIKGLPENDTVTSVTAGRGRIFFVRLPNGEEIVIRPYLHGGLFGQIRGGDFPDPDRFVSELILTEKAREAKVTVLRPLGLGYVRSRRGFRGFWLSGRLKEGCNLQTWMQKFPPEFRMVSRIAEIIARMHQAGISHPDLTIQNIMIVSDSRGGSTVSMIDFDGAVLRTPLPYKVCMHQLRRLDRSFLKWIPETSPWQTSYIRLRFAAAYCRFVPGIRPLMKNYLRKISWYLFRYRAGWRLQKSFKF